MRVDDFLWFEKNYDKLYKKYGKCYIAIKDKKVIGIYNSGREGVKETKKIEPLGTFIVQYCDGTKDAYTRDMISLSIDDFKEASNV